MKITRIRAGEYHFVNDNGFEGEILAQPEGGWTVFDPKSYTNLDYFPTKAAAVRYADALEKHWRDK